MKDMEPEKDESSNLSLAAKTQKIQQNTLKWNTI